MNANVSLLLNEQINKAVSYTHLLRQRHIDQAQSMNLYITNDYSMRQVLRL